jgi:CRP/FNR family transcriptional regulator
MQCLLPYNKQVTQRPASLYITTMLDPQTLTRMVRLFPWLHAAEPRLVHELREAAHLARIPPGRDIFVEGDGVRTLAFLLSGVVRVYKVAETGREITLYRFGEGESCILTANAILSHQTFPAIATVEQEAEVVLIPAAVFRDWVRRSDLWREFVFNLLAQRLASVMELVEEVAFRRLDGRIAGLLLAHSRRGHTITITHQQIAAELGSSREVVSRVLAHLADEGLIRQSRGSITILDAQALARLAAA